MLRTTTYQMSREKWASLVLTTRDQTLQRLRTGPNIVDWPACQVYIDTLSLGKEEEDKEEEEEEEVDAEG